MLTFREAKLGQQRQKGRLLCLPLGKVPFIWAVIIFKSPCPIKDQVQKVHLS